MLQIIKSRMTIMVFLSCLLAGFLPGCGEDTKNKRPKNAIETKPKETNEYTITISSAWVCEANPFGYVTEGSVCFDITRAEKGFIIYVKKDGDIISRTPCPKTKFNYWLDMVKYKLSIRDSLIERGKNSG